MTRSIVSRLLSWAGSLRVAAWLMAALGVLVVVSALVPQRAYLGSEYAEFAARAPAVARIVAAAGLDRVYGGWPITVVTALLGIDLVTCTALRISNRLPKHAAKTGRSEAASSQLEQCVAEAEGAGWQVRTIRDRSVTLVRGRSGFWGSVVMHAGLIVVIAGGVATSLTGFRGQAVIAEGQTIVDDPSGYESVSVVPRLGTAYRGTRIMLEDMDVRYSQGAVVSAVARMRAVLPDGRSVSKAVRVNHPLEAGGKSWLLQDSGYSVRIVVRDGSQRAAALAVKLAAETPIGWRDDIVVPSDQGDIRISLSATPRPVSAGERAVEEKLAIRDPRLALVIQRGDDRWEGTLAPGQTSGSADGVTVAFEGLDLWTRFLVRGEPARWVTYAGFWLVVVGALWRFAVPERRATLRCDDAGTIDAVVRVYPWMQTRIGGLDIVCPARPTASIRSGSGEEESPA